MCEKTKMKHSFKLGNMDVIFYKLINSTGGKKLKLYFYNINCK